MIQEEWRNIVERLVGFLYRKLDHFSFDEYLIMFVVCTIFLPFYCSIIAMVGVLGYLIYKKRLKKIIEEVPNAKFAILFNVLSFVVSLFAGNYLGAVCSVGVLVIFLFIFYYRSIVNKRLFELLMDACCIISWFCAIYAFAEYTKIVHRLNYDVFSFVVEDNPKNRINSTFFNANYYAMMIEFIVLICIYKMMQVKTKRRITFYIATIGVNLFILYLTGCRTAWIPFVVTIPFLFLMNKRYTYLTMTMSAYAGAGFMLILKPSIFQRATLFTDFMKRFKIWNCAFKGIEAHPWFGEGPLTYYHIYKQYKGHPTQHAHNVYLDPLLSHGIIGVLLALIYMIPNIKEIILLLKRRIDMRLCSLILACVLTVLIHGILDYTIYWIQTALLFLIILSSSSIYFHDLKMKKHE